MVSREDTEQLGQAAELIREVMSRHRGEDLRAVSIFNEAIQDLRVGMRYLAASVSPDLRSS